MIAGSKYRDKTMLHLQLKPAWPLAIFMAAFSLPSLADEPGFQARSAPYWYAAAAEGYGRLTSSTVGSDGLANQGAAGTTSQRRGHSDLGLTIGYQLTDTIGFEVAYQEIGKFRFSAPATSGDWTSGGMRMSVVGTQPLTERISLYARGGAFISRTKLNVGAPLANQSVTDTSITLGAGASYAFTPQIDATLGWDRYQGLGDATTGKSNADIFSLGVKYKF